MHGSNSNSFGWAALQRELTLRGHRVVAVDLPGHGFGATFPVSYQAPQDPTGLAGSPSGMARVTAAEAVEHVIGVVRRAAELGPVTLVGHSRGGVTVTGVANEVPELLHRIVYISAWCCVDLPLPEYLAAPENASSVLHSTGGALVAEPAALGALRLNWRTADPDLLATLKTAMLAEGTDDEFRAFLNTLEPDEGLDVGDAQAKAETWGRVRRTYVRLTGDRSLPIELQDRFIEEADALTPDNPFDVHSLDSSHVGFLIHPEQAADVLAGLD
ncbi:alpha/beta hydrolase [Saccharopolyspora taberi]|uniref:Alpha/beta hydrolase n=1 Tax=Saccharopolyspora taberi TaxID=60895 RepID=A0ABN3VCH7_9PSEU